MKIELPNEKEVITFLDDNKDMSADDMLVFIANTIVYKDSVPAPILGFGDNIQSTIEYLRGEADKIKHQFCIMYCSDSKISEKLKSDGQVQGFIYLMDYVKQVLEGAEFAELTSIEGGVLMAITFLIKKTSSTLDELCDC